MVLCPNCEVEKSADEFGKNSARDTGIALYCRECARIKAKEYRIRAGVKKPEGWARKTADMREYRKKWDADHPGYHLKKKREWFKAHPDRSSVKSKVRYALLTGKLIPSPCSICGAVPAQAHHPDYSKPLEVVWLCQVHHIEEHKRLRELEFVCESELNVVDA
jgi:hypothetical protein